MPVALTKYRIKDLTQITAEPELLNKVIELESATGADKNFKVSVPTLIQTVVNNLPAPQKVSHIIVRTYDTTDPNYVTGESTLVGESQNRDLVMWMTAYVEFPNNPSLEYRLIYDPNGPFQAYKSTAYEGGKLGARWVVIGSADDAGRSFADFNPFQAKYTKSDNVKYTINNALRLFTAKQDLVKSTFGNNQIPAPTGLDTDTYWTEINAKGNTMIRTWLVGSYKKDEVVIYNGTLYRAKRDVILGDPDEIPQDFYDYPKPTFWETIGGSGGGSVNLTNITENVGGFHAGESFAGTNQEAWSKLLITYQNPAFSTFTFDDQGSRTVLTGTVIQNQSHTFGWGTSNGANIQPNTIVIQDVTANTPLVINTANDGLESAVFGGYTIGVGESRRYRITATTTNSNTIAADVVLYGALARFWGASSLTPSQLKAQLTSGATIDPNGLNFQVDLATTISNNITVDCSGGKYVYFLYDANLPNPSVVRAGVNTFSAYTVETLNITDQLGNSRAYKLLYTSIQYGQAVNVNVVN